MASPNVIELTESNWNEHVTSGTLVVADFWAPWCGPCRQLSPTMDRIADQFAGKVKVGKLNVDENPNIAVKYDVMTIPRILFFKGGDTPRPPGSRRDVSRRTVQADHPVPVTARPGLNSSSTFAAPPADKDCGLFRLGRRRGP